MSAVLYKTHPPIDGVYMVSTKQGERPAPYLFTQGRTYDQAGDEVVNIDCYWRYVSGVNTWVSHA